MAADPIQPLAKQFIKPAGGATPMGEADDARVQRKPPQTPALARCSERKAAISVVTSSANTGATPAASGAGAMASRRSKAALRVSLPEEVDEALDPRKLPRWRLPWLPDQ
jgi:hypothetical protein